VKLPKFSVPKLGVQKPKKIRRMATGHSYSSYFSQKEGSATKKMNFRAMMRKQELERLKKQVL
jgi:hypothetical protein